MERSKRALSPPPGRAAEQELSEAVVTIEQAAQLLGVNNRMIYELLRTGQLRGLRYGRQWQVQLAEIEGYLRREHPAPDPEIQAAREQLLHDLRTRHEALDTLAMDARHSAERATEQSS